MSSQTPLSDHCNSLRLFICQSSVFEDLWTFITHGSKSLSFLLIWTLRQHFSAKMFDVGDLPVLTFCNCVLNTGLIKWPLKLHTYVFTFFPKSKKNMTFLSFWVVAHNFSTTGWHHCALYLADDGVLVLGLSVASRRQASEVHGQTPGNSSSSEHELFSALETSQSPVQSSGTLHRQIAEFCQFCQLIRWGWLGSRVVSVLNSGAEGHGFKSQPQRCRVKS